MELIQNENRKLNVWIFLKFLWSFNWRTLLLSYLLICAFTGLVVICMHNSFGNSMVSVLLSKVTPFLVSKSFFYTFGIITVIPVTIYSLKWSTTKSYKTFKVIWKDEQPKNIFDKQFFYPACAFAVSILMNAILVHLFITHSFLERVIGEIIEVMLLLAFMKNNWFNFRLERIE